MPQQLDNNKTLLHMAVFGRGITDKVKRSLLLNLYKMVTKQYIQQMWQIKGEMSAFFI